MRPLKALAVQTAESGVPLSMVLKSDLGGEVLRQTSAVSGLVLQGGAAVHHVFGSPRFSADLDFAQQPDLDETQLGAALSAAAASARATWGACTLEAATSKGRLHRQNCASRSTRAALTCWPSSGMRLWSARWRPGRLPATSAWCQVESPAEIIADKLVAAVDRISARGATKLRDVLPRPYLDHFDPREAVRKVAALCNELLR